MELASQLYVNCLINKVEVQLQVYTSMQHNTNRIWQRFKYKVIKSTHFIQIKVQNNAIQPSLTRLTTQIHLSQRPVCQ